MKNSCIIAIIGVSVMMFAGCGEKHVSSDILTSENTEADFGVIYEKDGPAQRNLMVINTYGDTLRPLSTYTRCSCIEARVDREPVAPGDTLKISVVYNPSYRRGIFMEEIGVKCIGVQSMLSFIIKGDIVPMEHPVEEDCPYDFGNDIHLSHEVLHFGKNDAGQVRRMFIRCANSGKKPAELSFDAGLAYKDNFEISKELTLAPESSDTVWVGFKMPDGLAESDTLLFPVTLSLNGRPLEKKLRVKAVQDSTAR